MLVRTSFIRFSPLSHSRGIDECQPSAERRDASENYKTLTMMAEEQRKFAVDRIAVYMLSLDLLNVSEVFKKAFCARVNTRRRGDSVEATAPFMRK